MKIMRQPGNLIETLVTRVENDPGSIAFSCLDDQCNVVSQLSTQQLHTRSAAVAGRLQQIISPSDRVLLLFPQGTEFIYAFMGVIYSGAIPVVVAPPRDTRICHIRNIAEETGCKIVLTSTSVLNEVMQYFFRSKVLSEKIFLSVEEISDDLMDHWSMPLIENNSVAYLQRTSGDKKENHKFVMVSHENMKNTCEYIKNKYNLTTSSRSINWLPHYHYLGLVSGILQPLYCGYRGYIYSLSDFYKNPHGWLHAISQYKATFNGAPDFAYNMCVEQTIDSRQDVLDLSRWSTAYSSGEPVNRETMDAFLKKFNDCGFQKSALTSIYGLAESAHVTSGHSYPDNHENVNIISCGVPASDTQVVIVVPGTRIKCAEPETGEILVNSERNARGYWGKPEETEEIFNIYLEGSDDGPYLRTGDLGFIKEGEVYVVGKLNDDRKVTHPSVDISQDQPVNEKITH